MNIDDLGLSPAAHAGASALSIAHPWLQFTSGRRSILKQALAMAQNVMSNPEWIGHVYLYGASLQRAVDAYRLVYPTPGLKLKWDVESLMNVLLYRLNEMPPSEQLKISRHLTGDAFDCAYEDSERMQEAIDMARELNGVDKVLTDEDGHHVLHVQFIANYSKQEV